MSRRPLVTMLTRPVKELPVWLMVLIYPFEIVTSQAISYFALFLKSNPSGRTFTQYQVNLIPTGGQGGSSRLINGLMVALQIVATLSIAALSDKLNRRWQVICGQIGLGTIGYILLASWDNVGFNGQFAGESTIIDFTLMARLHADLLHCRIWGIISHVVL